MEMKKCAFGIGTQKLHSRCTVKVKPVFLAKLEKEILPSYEIHSCFCRNIQSDQNSNLKLWSRVQNVIRMYFTVWYFVRA